MPNSHWLLERMEHFAAFFTFEYLPQALRSDCRILSSHALYRQMLYWGHQTQVMLYQVQGWSKGQTGPTETGLLHAGSSVHPAPSACTTCSTRSRGQHMLQVVCEASPRGTGSTGSYSLVIQIQLKGCIFQTPVLYF